MLLLHCNFLFGHEWSVTGGSSVTYAVGWTASPRGQVQDFLSGSSVVMTVDGTPVTPTLGEPQLTNPALDAWAAFWTFTMTAPPAGSQTVVTFQDYLTHPVHQFLEGAGSTSVHIGPGPLFTDSNGNDTPLSCTVTST